MKYLVDLILPDALSQAGMIGQSVPFILGLVFCLHFLPTALSEKSRERWRRWLDEDAFGSLYRRWMTWILDRVDARLTSETEQERGAKTTAWSRGLLNLTMLLAVAYPILAILGQWFFGGEGKIGDLLVIEAAAVEIRIPVFVWLTMVFLLFLGTFWAKALLRVASFVGAAGLLIGGQIYFLDTLGVFAVAVTVAILVAIAGAFAVAVAGAGAVTVVVAGAGTLAFAVEGAVAGAFAFAVSRVLVVWESRKGESAGKLVVYLAFQLTLLTSVLLLLQGDSEKLRFPVSGDEFDGTAAIILDHFNRSCR